MRYMGKKEYGNYKTDTCPFCGKFATLKNNAGIAVCKVHKDTESPALKCLCGDYVDIICGKFGNYASCIRCGNVQLKKILEHNGVGDERAHH